MLLLPVSILIVAALACTEKAPEGGLVNPDIDTEMYYETAYMDVEEMAEFPGGIIALRKFIAQNITYPSGAKENAVAGRVFVQFVVNKEGKVVTKLEEFKLEDGSKTIKEVVVVGYKPAEGTAIDNEDKYVQELKDEAVRVVSLLPDFEKPAMRKGEAVAAVFTVPINFALQ